MVGVTVTPGTVLNDCNIREVENLWARGQSGFKL